MVDNLAPPDNPWIFHILVSFGGWHSVCAIPTFQKAARLFAKPKESPATRSPLHIQSAHRQQRNNVTAPNRLA